MGRIPQFSTEEYPRTQGDVDSYPSGLDRVMALRFCESRERKGRLAIIQYNEELLMAIAPDEIVRPLCDAAKRRSR
jgi:hypothetical protein